MAGLIDEKTHKYLMHNRTVQIVREVILRELHSGRVETINESVCHLEVVDFHLAPIKFN